MKQLGEFLAAHREEVMQKFEERLRQAHAPEHTWASELRDGLPGYLRLLAESLKQTVEDDSAALAARAAAVAEEHGGQRLRLGFDPGSVVREYGYLCDCILAVAKQAGCVLDEPAVRNLADRINLTSSQAVAHYVHLRDEEQRQQAARHMSFLAHELRNPLTSAQLAMQLLANQPEVSRSRAGQVLLNSLDRLRDLIDTSLTTGLLEGGAPIERTALSLSELLAEAMSESDVYAHTKDIRLILNMEEGLTVEGDPRLLRSAVSNLLRNAVKFTPHGTVTIRASRQDQMARVEVEDCCGGLPEGKLASLFQPFVQIGGNRTGFGLGLAITRQAVMAHQGQVFVKDLPGKGCVFGFELPLVASPQAPTQLPPIPA